MSELVLKLEVEKINEVLKEQAEKAIRNSFDSYTLQSSLSDIITEYLVEESFRQALKEAISKVDTSSLVNHIASEMERSIVRAITTIIQESVVSMVVKLRGLSEYSDKEEIEKIRQMIRKGD